MVSRGSRSVISPSLPRHITRLSGDERSLLCHLTQRGPLSKIAQRIGVSELELDDMVSRLGAKLELTSASDVIKWAKKHGF
jgi:hypothetical protein